MPRIQGLTEKEFQNQIVQFAKMQGWEVYHTYNSQRSEPGFPDLVLARDRILYRELKSETGSLTFYQQKWGKAIEKAGGDWAVWRPSQIEAIYKELMRRPSKVAKWSDVVDELKAGEVI